MSEQESKATNYIDYPYDRFLKIRIEFLILTQNDLKARIMRLVERCVEIERETYYRAECNKPCNKNKHVEVPDGIFAEISHKFFMDEMWGTVQSETTLRDALKELENDHLIIRRPGGSGPYDPPLYTLNKPLIDHLFTLLPPLKEIDMISLMKQPRKKKKEDGTIETGPIIDPLAKLIRGAIIGPLDPQLLDPYTSIIAPLSSTRGVQKLYPIRYKENFEEKREETTTVSDDTKQSFDALTQEEIEMILALRNKQTTKESVVFQQPKQSRQNKITKVEPPQQPELPRLEEPDLTPLSEQEVQIYNNLLRKEDQPKYLAWEADKRNVYNSLLGKYGYTVPINITPKVDECMGQLKDEKPTVATFKEIDKYAHKNDQYYPNGKKKPVEKQFYKGRGLKPWDYVREYASWKSQISIVADGEGSSTGNLSSLALTHDDAQQLAIDAVEQGKHHGYDIQANAYAKNGTWMVNIVWDGFPIPANTRAEWEATFNENLEHDQLKGAK
jgi:hypothetical protein